MPIISTLLRFLLSLLKNGESSDAPSAPKPTISNLNETTVLVKIQRLSRSPNAIFGKMVVNGDTEMVTMENVGKAIKAGCYEAILDLSPHLGYRCPHLQVPDRDTAAGGDAGIRIHVANYPSQLEGCFAVGTVHDGDAIDNSKMAFDNLMSVLPPKFKVLIQD